MYAIHYLHPERTWGVFANGVFVMSFKTIAEAQAWIERQGADE